MMAAAAAQLEGQAEVVAFLASGAAFGGVRPRRVDTHAAHLFLVGDRAWKLKRDVRYGYLDFSNSEKRRTALAAELRLNRRTAPSLYLGLHPITVDADDNLAIDGAGEAVDWLLEMQRFPDGALLSEIADEGRLDEIQLLQLADSIFAFHHDAEQQSREGAVARFLAEIDGNIASMRQYPRILPPDLVTIFEDAARTAFRATEALLESRGRAGRVRHGHGDLHLANIALIDGRLTPFDCVEFSGDLATVDVLYDLAFLLMDLWHRGLRTPANMIFNRYLDLSGLDESGVALMPLFLATRAAVRSHVLAAQAKDDAARGYLDLALALLTPVRSQLVAIGGLSGTGKSTLARALGGDIGRAPGARILRSDVLRKRLAGVPPETKLSSQWYTAKTTRDVYDFLCQRSAQALAAGQSVIADAVFATSCERRAIAAVVEGTDAGFTGLWLKAEDHVRITRVGSRPADASDADREVAIAQTRYQIGPIGDWRVVPACGSIAETATAARALLAPGGATGPREITDKHAGG